MVEITTEKQFRDMVLHLAKLCGWKPYFTWNSLHSPAGYPDLTLLRGDQLIVTELKTEKGKVTPKQQEWIDAWEEFCRHSPNTRVFVWRPSQWEEIVNTLQKPIDKGNNHQ